MELEMSRYKRRIIYASISLHIIAGLAYFVYWLSIDPFKVPPPEKQFTQSSNQLAEGETNEEGGQKEEIPDTGKNPLLDYEDGDLSNKKIASLLENSFEKNKDLTLEEKVENLNSDLKGISRTPVKEVEKMTNLAEKAFGIEKEKSSNPVREPKPGERIDPDSLELYDFEQIDDKFVFIYKDKNNLILKGEPTEYKDIDPDMKVRLTLMKKGKENKKFKMLLDTTNAILNKLHPRESEKSSSN